MVYLILRLPWRMTVLAEPPRPSARAPAPLRVTLKEDAVGKLLVSVKGGFSKQNLGDGGAELDVIDIPASAPTWQDVTGPVSELESDTTDMLSGTTDTMPDVSNVVQPRPDTAMPPLKPHEAFYLVLYNRGITSDRDIGKASEKAVAEGEEGAIRIPKGTAGGIKKRLKKRDYIQSE